MRKIVVFCLFAVIGFNSALSAQNLPDTAMGKPKIFNDESQSYKWSEIVKTKQWGELSLNFWRVFIDRTGVNAYQAPSSYSKVKKSNLEFMHPYYIAKIDGDFALLYEEKYSQTNLKISKLAKAVGWVKLSELLLWTTCPRTRNQVYQKAVILKDVDAVRDKRDLDDPSPLFSIDPYKLVSTKTAARAVELEFYFVFKKTENGSALLVKECKIGDNSSPVMGWMKSGNYTTWNDRLCYEPQFVKTQNNKYKAIIFESSEDAVVYNHSGEIRGNVLLKIDLPKDRWPARKTRFPVVKPFEKYNYAQVGTIGSAGGAVSNADAAKKQEQIDKADEKKDALMQKMAQVNVVFVIDGTSSMRNYYQPVARAIKDAMRRDALKGAHVRFGAVIYRNYADTDVIEYRPLTADAEGIASWLVSRQCHSVSNVHHEAMLYGLETALDKMGWRIENANFLVHIGDAGNALPDAKGRTIAGVARKMADKEVNYIGFQANHPDQIAYHDFCSQMMGLMVTELKILWNRDVKRSDFKDRNHRLKEVVGLVNGNQIVSAAYHYAEVNHSESANDLKELIEQKIGEFNVIARSELDRLEAAVNIMGYGGNKSGVVEAFDNVELFLTERGFTKEEIKVLKDRNVILKLKGYATRVANGREDVFIPSVFLALPELDDLIQSLSRINSSVSGNRRKELQVALKRLSLTYIGQISADMTVEDVMRAVTDVRSGTGNNPLANISLDEIEDVNKVTDEMLEAYIRRITTDVETLKRLRRNPSCYYDSPNGLRYYYILMRDMPLQGN